MRSLCAGALLALSGAILAGCGASDMSVIEVTGSRISTVDTGADETGFTSTSSLAAPPVYHVTYSTGAGAGKNELPDGEPVTTSFWVGPAGGSAALTNSDVNTDILKQARESGGIQISVTAICHVCKDTTPESRALQLDANGNSVAKAQFHFVPDTDGRPKKYGSITFSVTKEGIEYDFVNAPVLVKRPDAVAEKAPRPDVCKVSWPQSLDAKAFDLIIFTSYNGQGGITATFRPISQNLRAAIGTWTLDPNGEPLAFHLGGSANGVAQDLAREFIILKSMIDQTAGINGVVDAAQLAGGVDVFMTSQQRDAVSESLYGIGVNLYNKLFYGASGDVPKILKSIEEVGSTTTSPLRIGFFSNGIYVPWQLLHPIRTDPNFIDIGGFWGFKYIISSIPQNEGRACGALPDKIAWPTENNVIYGAYRSVTPADPNNPDFVTSYAALYADSLKSTFHMARVHPANTSHDFLNGIVSGRDGASSVIVYGHGHSGTNIVELQAQPALPGVPPAPAMPLIVPDQNGAHIDFSQSDLLTSGAFERATVREDHTVPYLRSHPLVFLNGCETGTAGIDSTNENSFPGMFLDLGASSVIATEAPVWDKFGLGFSNELIALLSAGESLGDALFDIRRKYLKVANNPLGLIYTLYGNPNVTYVLSSS